MLTCHRDEFDGVWRAAVVTGRCPRCQRRPSAAGHVLSVARRRAARCNVHWLRTVVTEEVTERLLYIGNLPEDCSDEDVESLFSAARYVFVVREPANENGDRKCKG